MFIVYIFKTRRHSRPIQMANSIDDSGRKPHCIGDRIECFSMKDMTLIEMSFSNTLDTTERSDIGR